MTPASLHDAHGVYARNWKLLPTRQLVVSAGYGSHHFGVNLGGFFDRQHSAETGALLSTGRGFTLGVFTRS